MESPKGLGKLNFVFEGSTCQCKLLQSFPLFNSVVEWNSFQKCCCTQLVEKLDAVRATSLWLKCKRNRCASFAFHMVAERKCSKAV